MPQVNPSLTNEELERYSRHFVMPEIGPEGQNKLKTSSVLVVGAGGLGIPAAIYLAAAGVGRIGLVDFDTIQASNLHRQILYSVVDVGKKKVEVAKFRLGQVNPLVAIEAHDIRLDSSNAMELIGNHDIILDCTDNFPARYLLNDACALSGKPDVYASVFRFDGQATVFHRSGPCYRCLYPEPPPPDSVPSCAEAGVLGVLPGILGGIQAAEAINLLLGIGSPLVGRLLLLNAYDIRFTELKIAKNPSCPVCGSSPSIRKLIDYDAFCGVAQVNAPSTPEVTPASLDRWMKEGRDFFLLDVREPFEHQMCHIDGSKLIPLGQLRTRVGELDKSGTLVVYCHTGQRSSRAVEYLLSAGFKDARNLAGGIAAWARDVDPKMVVY